jgi:hypothetical protein
VPGSFLVYGWILVRSLGTLAVNSFVPPHTQKNTHISSIANKNRGAAGPSGSKGEQPKQGKARRSKKKQNAIRKARKQREKQKQTTIRTTCRYQSKEKQEEAKTKPPYV